VATAGSTQPLRLQRRNPDLAALTRRRYLLRLLALLIGGAAGSVSRGDDLGLLATTTWGCWLR